jgi:beta-carotene 3-hydroxylase
VIATVAIVAVAFVAMEPATYLAHRFVMHGVGMRLHRSHHRRWPRRRPDDPFLEANDAFPVVFAGITMVALAVGFNVDGLSVLLPICGGATLYGAAYAFVHDGYIHSRLPVRWRSGLLDRLADAHALHHRFGGEPFGMLLPVVPASVRERAEAADRRSSDQRVASVPRP